MASATRPERLALGAGGPWADEVVLAAEEPGLGAIATTAQYMRPRRRADAARRREQSSTATAPAGSGHRIVAQAVVNLAAERTIAFVGQSTRPAARDAVAPSYGSRNPLPAAFVGHEQAVFVPLQVLESPHSPFVACKRVRGRVSDPVVQAIQYRGHEAHSSRSSPPLRATCGIRPRLPRAFRQGAIVGLVWPCESALNRPRGTCRQASRQALSSFRAGAVRVRRAGRRDRGRTMGG
jgi:hypothetical protein